MAERRRTRRVSLRIPVSVEGIDKSGRPFAEHSTTIEINRDGARIGLNNTLRLGAELRITNLLTNATALFRSVVQCPQSYAGLPEWGVALSSPLADLIPDFWGIAFEDLSEQSQPDLDVSAFLCCRKCGRREMVGLTELEYRVLRTRLVLPRVCSACRGATDWEAAPPEQPRFPPAPLSEPEDGRRAAPPEEQPVERQLQRRVARRIAVQVPLLIRAPGGKFEQTTSRNVSKHGLSFATMLDLNPGDEIEVLVGYGVTKSPAAQIAHVIWRRPDIKGVRALVGVHFTAAESTKVPEEAETVETKRVRKKPRAPKRRPQPD